MATRKWGAERTIGDYDVGLGYNAKDWDVASLDGGGYVVTWLDRTTANITARGQRYDAAGNTVGAVFEVGASLVGFSKSDIVVTGIDGGGFVVAFTHGANAGDSWYQRYNAAGVVQSTVLVDSNSEAEGNMAIVRRPGGFNLVETDQYENGLDTNGIWFTGFDLTDSQTVGFTLANTGATVGEQTDPSIAALTGGETVVSWVDNNDLTIKFQVFDTVGLPTTGPLIVDDDTFVNGVPGYAPQVVGLANGNFIIVWSEFQEPDSADQSGYAVRGMIYSATGIQQSGLMLINSLRPGNQSIPDVVATPDGGFFVSWIAAPANNAVSDIKGLLFDAGGIRVGAEITINTTTGASNIDPHMTVLSDGRIVAVWGDVTDGNLRSQIIDPRDGIVDGTSAAETLYGHDSLGDVISAGAGADTVYGLAGADTIYGGNGADLINAGRGDDTVYGGNDGDNIRGDAGDDELYGEAGSDTLLGGLGADFLNGGDGFDFANYHFARGVYLDMNDPFASTGEAFGDSFFSIEGIVGSAGFADTILGDVNPNIIYGQGGADILDGRGGNDTLYGGAAGDTMTGGTGPDRFLYVAATEGGDTITDFAAGDKIQLTAAAFGLVANPGAGYPLAPSAFLSGAGHVANSVNTRIMVDTTSHTLWYDSDGTGATGPVLLATFSNNYNPIIADFLVT
jgi:Ca2+-binding RTX toxin-like protein